MFCFLSTGLFTDLLRVNCDKVSIVKSYHGGLAYCSGDWGNVEPSWTVPFCGTCRPQDEYGDTILLWTFPKASIPYEICVHHQKTLHGWVCNAIIADCEHRVTQGQTYRWIYLEWPTSPSAAPTAGRTLLSKSCISVGHLWWIKAMPLDLWIKSKAGDPVTDTMHYIVLRKIGVMYSELHSRLSQSVTAWLSLVPIMRLVTTAMIKILERCGDVTKFDWWLQGHKIIYLLHRPSD